MGLAATVTDSYFGQTCLTLNDCGAIYAGRIGGNANIRGNLVENVIGGLAGLPGIPQRRTVGIYLDDLNTGSTVANNTVSGADNGVQVHNASSAQISNNVLFGNRRYQLWFQEDSAKLRTLGDVFGSSVSGNMFVPTASGPAVYLQSEIGDTSDFASFNANHYSALFSPKVIGERPIASASGFTVAEWLGASREVAALVTQPVGYASFLAANTNLVPNGNLAGGKAGWSSWNQTAPASSTTVQTCGLAPCIVHVTGGSESLLISPNFSVTAGQWYRVSFDAATSSNGQAISAVVRRGGGGTANYELLMPAAESFVGATAWRRYSFAFQASKTVNAGDPLTRELGARIDFERNMPGTTLKIARLEMVALTPATAALQVKLLLNRERVANSYNCAALGGAEALCGSYYYMSTGNPVSWPATVPALSGSPVYTRDTSLSDSDGDGIADQQDTCPGSAAGMAVNARGCAFNQ